MNQASANLTGISKGLGIFLAVVLIVLQVACSSRGVAPVYSRDSVPVPAKQLKPGASYQVRRGDTLYSIAWRYRLDFHLLAAWNRIKGPGYRIYPGQWLRLKPPPLTKRSLKRQPAKSKLPPPVAKKKPPVAVPKPRAKVTVPAPQPRAKISAPEQRPVKTATRKVGTQKLKLDWRWPTIGRVVQTYSSTDPDRKGVRISGVPAQPVVAAEAGRVVYSGSGLVGYGNLVIIKHNKQYLSAYGYNKKLLVKEGDQVARGEQIAYMGSPRNGADSLLHFEIRKQGKPINPLPLLPKL